MARSKIVAKQVRMSKGKKIGVNLIDENGRKFSLLNPHGKGAKYAAELHEKKRFTNGGQVKKDKSGNSQSLSNTQAAWRSGYLAAQKDSARAYKAKH